MSVIDKLASSLNFRGTEPNITLAKEIAEQDNREAVKELVDNLANKNKNIQSDCIKTLYEIGYIKPGLIAGYAKVFIALLDNKNNRLQWGAMTALDMITAENPKLIYEALGKIIAVADKGSVITRDHCVGILTKLCAVKQYSPDAFILLAEQLKSCPTNQLPMYAEHAMPVIAKENKNAFIKLLQSRLEEMDKESKRKRIEKVIRKLS
jgi:hypothetical protein